MSAPLNLFPSHVPIGRTADGKPVFMSPEYSRALAGVLERLGGPTGMGTDELGTEAAISNTGHVALALGQAVEALELAQATGNGAHLALAIGRALEEVQLEMVALHGRFAALADLAQQMAAIEAATVTVVPPVDWEHAGKIGAGTPNSGAFTTLAASGKTTLNPADANVDIKPTGTGTATLKPAAMGQVDNVELGTTVPRAARVLSVNKITIVEPATSGYIQIADTKGLAVNRSITLTASADGITLNIAGGGTLGTAAFRNGGATTENWTAATLTSSGGFACNGADPQGKQNSGGTLAGVIQCLKNNGILSG